MYSQRLNMEQVMELTNTELNRLKRYARVYREDCERKMRKIRRNIDKIQDRYIELSIADPDGGHISPKDDLKYLKDCKAEATLMIKKIELIQSLKKDD